MPSSAGPAPAGRAEARLSTAALGDRFFAFGRAVWLVVAMMAGVLLMDLWHSSWGDAHVGEWTVHLVLGALAIGTVSWLAHLGRQQVAELRRLQDQLMAVGRERERLAALWRALPAGAVVHGPDGRILDANPMASDLLGLTHEQLLGLTSMDPRWRALDAQEQTLQGQDHPAMRTLRTGRPSGSEVMGVALPDGKRRWLRVQSWPLAVSSVDTAASGPAAGGLTSAPAMGAVAVFVDVTEARSQRRLLELSIEAGGLGTWDENLATGESRFNARWYEMLGLSPGGVLAHRSTWASRVHPEDLPRAAQAMQAHLADPTLPYRAEIRMRHADGHWLWVLAAGSVIERDTHGRPWRVAGIHIDITSRKHREQRWSLAAHTDALTGLANRPTVDARLGASAEALRRGEIQTLAVLMLDVDGFKALNDRLGHAAGDQLLQEVARRLKAVLRPGDGLARDPSLTRVAVQGPQASNNASAPGPTPPSGIASTAARLGGDEFVFWIEDPSDRQAIRDLARRVSDRIAAPTLVNGERVTCSASTGIVWATHGHRAFLDCTADALLRHADRALHAAQQRGSGEIAWSDENGGVDAVAPAGVCAPPSAGGPLAVSTPAATDTPQIADTPPWVGLRPDTATTHATQYWPVVDLRTRLIGGLVVQAATPSWASARVPAAHQAALDIEHVERAVTGLSLLSQAGSSSVALTMGLPLSLATVRNARACHDLRQLRLRSGWPSGTLRLDLDATAFVSEADAELVATLHGLRAAGWVLGLRDFGAGLASLASLDHAPFTTVALDASLGRGLAANTFAGAIMGATGLVAQSLGQDVIATGIDNEADAAAALRARCRWATGPLAGASMPASAVLRALTADGSASRLLH